jgi:hypothetical protein
MAGDLVHARDPSRADPGDPVNFAAPSAPAQRGDAAMAAWHACSVG